MVASIFRNFDPDEITSQFNASTSFGVVPNLYLLIIQALASCGKWNRRGSFRTLRSLKNEDFVQLAASIHELTSIGFENKKTMSWFEDVESLKFDDISAITWALHGKECRGDVETTACQINAMAALWLIDDAMTLAESNGITSDFIEALALAAIHMSEAQDAEANDSRKYLLTSIPSALEKEYKQRQREAYSMRAKLRHNASNKAREFVTSEWMHHKDAYQGNKSAFARDYVSIVANRFTDSKGDPLKITEKQMREVWLADPTADRKLGQINKQTNQTDQSPADPKMPVSAGIDR